MPKVTFITRRGAHIEVEASVDRSLMEAAVAAGVDGIDADCGGGCSCATCHVHVDPEWRERVGPANDTEAGMLEFTEGVNEYSRLSCQIRITDALDGLVVRVVDE